MNFYKAQWSLLFADFYWVWLTGSIVELECNKLALCWMLPSYLIPVMSQGNFLRNWTNAKKSFAGMQFTSHLESLHALGKTQSWSTFGLKPDAGVDLIYTELVCVFFISGSISSSVFKGPVEKISSELWLKYNFVLFSNGNKYPEFLNPQRDFWGTWTATVAICWRVCTQSKE